MKNQIKKYYFEHSEILEQLSKGRFEREPLFLDKIFRKYGKVKTVLDVGCGTGAHLNELAKMGYKRFGIDLSRSIINYARKKCPNIKFETKDMRKLNYKNRFDAIICLCTTFCYNLNNKDILLTLANFRKALKKDGILVIDVFNPISFIEKIRYKRVRVETHQLGGLKFKEKLESRINENSQTLMDIRTTYLNNKKVKINRTVLRMFFPQEMRAYLELSGFKFIDFYGSYDLKNKVADAARLITVAKRK